MMMASAKQHLAGRMKESSNLINVLMDDLRFVDSRICVLIRFELFASFFVRLPFAVHFLEIERETLGPSLYLLAIHIRRINLGGRAIPPPGLPP